MRWGRCKQTASSLHFFVPFHLFAARGQAVSDCLPPALPYSTPVKELCLWRGGHTLKQKGGNELALVAEQDCSAGCNYFGLRFAASSVVFYLLSGHGRLYCRHKTADATPVAACPWHLNCRQRSADWTDSV